MLSNNPVDQIKNELATCSVEQYLALSEDAVFVCSEDGSVVTCNDKARTLVGSNHSLEGTSIRDHFSFPYECDLPAETLEVVQALNDSRDAEDREQSDLENFNNLKSSEKEEGIHFSPYKSPNRTLSVYSGNLPYYKNAVPQIVISGTEEEEKICRLRCQALDEMDGIYLVVAREIELMWEITQKQLAQNIDLKRTNKRLHGALTTIVETIHAQDIQTLFHESLVNLQNMMESDGAAIYLAEKNGFHLQEASSMYEEMPIFMPIDSGIPEVTISEGRTTLMKVVDVVEKPGDYQLEDHYIIHPEVGDDIEVPSYHMLPYDTFMSIPVWYGKHIIALIFVGWDENLIFNNEEVRLMDTISHYLSVQIMGASRVLRARHRQKIATAESHFYDRVNDYDELSKDIIMFELKRMANLLDIKLRSITISPYTGNTILESERFGSLELPFGIESVIAISKESDRRESRHEPNYRSLSLDGSVMQWVNNNFEPSRIAAIDFGDVFGEEMMVALVRTIDQKPFDTPELKLFLRIGHFLQNLSRRITSSKNNKQISAALQQGMQNTLQHVPGIYSTSLYSSATAEAFVGGDFYDLINLPDNKACVIMGDVSGKGVDAASVSAAVKTSLAAYAWTGLTPCEMVRNLNHFLMGFTRFETFVTLFVGVIDLKTRKLTYCSAGHPPTFIYKAKDNIVDLLNVQSGVVGAFDDMHYKDGEVDLETGDSIFMYTDGVIEARAEDGTFFGERNLREFILECAPCGIEDFDERIIDKIRTFTNNHLDDDMAVVALCFDFESESLKDNA